MFLFKPKTIVVDCFTAEQSAYDWFPITPAKSHIPQWWKDTDSTYDRGGVIADNTIKKCDGFINLYNKGFILPLWSDLAIDKQEKGFRWQYSDGKSVANTHDPRQWNTYVSEQDYFHIKLSAPWRMKSKNSMDWLYTAPAWNYKPDVGWTIVTGVIDYKYSSEVNVNILIDRKSIGTILLNADSPLVHMIPLTDKKVIIKSHIVTKEEYERYAMPTIKFSKYIPLMKQLEKKAKCPFGFGS